MQERAPLAVPLTQPMPNQWRGESYPKHILCPPAPTRSPLIPARWGPPAPRGQGTHRVGGGVRCQPGEAGTGPMVSWSHL